MMRRPNRLREARNRLSLSQERLAELADMTASQVSRYETGITPAFNDGFLKIARVLKTSPESLVGSDGAGAQVHLVGDVGAGAEVIPLDDGQDWVPGPPGPGRFIAVRVRGSSMSPVYREGDVLFAEERACVSLDVLGRDCIVQVHDGPRLVKRVLPGGAPGTFRLFSYENSDVSDDISLDWAAPVRWIRR